MLIYACLNKLFTEGVCLNVCCREWCEPSLRLNGDATSQYICFNLSRICCKNQLCLIVDETDYYILHIIIKSCVLQDLSFIFENEHIVSTTTSCLLPVLFVQIDAVELQNCISIDSGWKVFKYLLAK